MDDWDGYPSDEDPPDDVTCKRCGKDGLTWYNIGSNRHPEWKLFDQVFGRLVRHTCNNIKKMADNAFEDESNG